MIIEFFGLPGAYKSTLAKKLAVNTDYRIIKIREKKELFWYNFLFLIKHPIRFFRLFVFLIKNYCNRKIFYFKLMNTFLDYNAKFQKALRYKYAILDQGYFTNVLSLFERSLSEKEIKKYLKYILFPDKLIIMDINLKDSLENTRKRGRFARDRYGEEYKRKWQKAMGENLETFKKVLPGLNVKYAIIDGQKALEDQYREILQVIK